jgi:ABC-type thiamine transport system ATPase subunit
LRKSADLIGVGVSPGLRRRALEESRVVNKCTGFGMDGFVHAVVPKGISSEMREE